MTRKRKHWQQHKNRWIGNATAQVRFRNSLASAQGWLCAYCKEPMHESPKKDNGATLDHFVARSRGGLNRVDNLVVACSLCNQDKADRHGADYLAIQRLKTMEPSTAVIGAAFGALIAIAMGKIIRNERSDARMLRAADNLLRLGYSPNPPEQLHKIQDVTGDMPPESPVRAAIKAAEARKYGGDQDLRETERWRAPRLVDPRPANPRREWA